MSLIKFSMQPTLHVRNLRCEPFLKNYNLDSRCLLINVIFLTLTEVTEISTQKYAKDVLITNRT
jgi:hypothetical protein